MCLFCFLLLGWRAWRTRQSRRSTISDEAHRQAQGRKGAATICKLIPFCLSCCFLRILYFDSFFSCCCTGVAFSLATPSVCLKMVVCWFVWQFNIFIFIGVPYIFLPIVPMKNEFSRQWCIPRVSCFCTALLSPLFMVIISPCFTCCGERRLTEARFCFCRLIGSMNLTTLKRGWRYVTYVELSLSSMTARFA